MLPLTLWVVAMLGLWVVVSQAWVTRAVENAIVLRQKTDDELALADIKNELVFALGTRPMSVRGLETGGGLRKPDIGDDSVAVSDLFSDSYIAFDHRPYRAAGTPGYIVRLQDARGLLNLNSATPAVLERFFAQFGLSTDQSDRLADTLADWIDDDDLTRLSGAEAQAYARRGRLPPANAQLMTPLEAQNVLGWDEIPDVWREDRRSPLFTSCAVAGLNPKTAPARVLVAYFPGLRPDLANVFTADRPQATTQDAVGSLTALGVNPAEDGVIAAPGNCFVVDVTAEASGERTRMTLSLLPFSEDRPWQVDSVLKIPKEEPPEPLAAAPVFPTPEMLTAPQSALPVVAR